MGPSPRGTSGGTTAHMHPGTSQPRRWPPCRCRLPWLPPAANLHLKAAARCGAGGATVRGSGAPARDAAPQMALPRCKQATGQGDRAPEAPSVGLGLGFSRHPSDTPATANSQFWQSSRQRSGLLQGPLAGLTAHSSKAEHLWACEPQRVAENSGMRLLVNVECAMQAPRIRAQFVRCRAAGPQPHATSSFSSRPKQLAGRC